MSILEYLRTQGKEPKRQRMRGDPPGPSVEGRRKKKYKEYADRNTRPAGMDTSGNPYRHTGPASKVKVGDTFGQKIKRTKKVTGVYPRTKGAYKIKKGDTLSGIAKREGTTVAELMRLNRGIKDKNKIRAGAGLNLPPKGKKEPVTTIQEKKKKGEGLFGDAMGMASKGGVMKAVKGKLAKDAVKTVFRRIRGKPSDFLTEKASDLVLKFDRGQINLPQLKGELRKRMKDSYKKIKRRQDETEEAGYLKEYRDKGKKVFPKKKAGGMLKTPPAGKKGKGLRKLPTAVRNKMGYKKRGGMLRMSGGGSASGFGRAAMRPGKDPRSISKT